MEVLRACRRHSTPVVARGAGTGLSGGALPVEGGVLLVLARLDRILEVDPVRRLARVQPGVTNLEISNAAAPHGLYYAPDPSSQVACTIGGNVAENSGGVHCLKHGLTVHNLLELRVATIEGEWLTLGSPAGEAPGLPLLALLTGSEGMLGVVVEVTVRLKPVPERVELLMAVLRRRAPLRRRGRADHRLGHRAGRARDDGRAGDPRRRGVRALRLPAGRRGPAALRARRPRARRRVASLRAAQSLLRACGATAVRVAADAAERLRMWSGRKSAFPAVGRLAPDYFCMDGTIPRRQPRRRARGHRRALARGGAAGRERVPRRRRQPAPADPVRRRPPGRGRARRAARCGDPRALRRRGRHGDRRARRRRREARARCARSSGPTSSRRSTR